MRIVCSSCAAEYEVPALRLRPGKLVRCARCGNKWLPVDQAEEGAPSDTADEQRAPDVELQNAGSLPEVTAMDRLAATPVRPAARTGLIAAWVLTFVVLASAVAATVGWRDEVVRAWPPSGRILTTTGHSAARQSHTAVKKAE
jgi:predicted Zn finger-like uncharacterized protein